MGGAPAVVGSLLQDGMTRAQDVRLPLTLLALMLTNSSASQPSLADPFTEAPRPPVARTLLRVDEIHGERRVDDYFWLRDKKDPEVAAYLEAENAYTDAVLKPTQTLQEALYKEMLGRIKETDMKVPYRKSGFYYYSRTEQGKQYPIYCRKKGRLSAPEQVTLELNTLAEGRKFMALGSYTVSDDTHLLAYSTDDTGFPQYTLYVTDLRTGEIRENVAQKEASAPCAAH